MQSTQNTDTHLVYFYEFDTASYRHFYVVLGYYPSRAAAQAAIAALARRGDATDYKIDRAAPGEESSGIPAVGEGYKSPPGRLREPRPVPGPPCRPF